MKFVIIRKIGDVAFSVECTKEELINNQKALETIFGEMRV